ncbi:metallophosphoesterase [Orbaceae bacterium ESL0727]|nr:metallophosphoesterase [Orbaceae bacterium ESL0727]
MNFVHIIAIVVSFLIAFYLGKRWQFWFNFHLSGVCRVIYWIIVLLAGYSLILPRLLQGISTYWVPFICDIVFGLFICFLYVLIVFDLLYVISFKKFAPNLVTKIIYIICSVALFIYGNDMAIRPKIVEYQVSIDKPANVDKLRIVQLSDIHTSEVITPSFIQQMVDEVNKLDADLIVITGDTIDDRLDPFITQGFNRQFQNMKAKYGTYVVFGNHEYLSVNKPNNSVENIESAFKSANMHILKDDIFYDDKLGITLVGRDDLTAGWYGEPRAPLADLLTFTDPETPIILLDHQPKDLDEPAKLGVDLMISGHTHGGQLFPVTLIVDEMYKNPHGIYTDHETAPNHNFISIVSSGYGLWGPPVRLMTRSEIVVIDVAFNKKDDPMPENQE